IGSRGCARCWAVIPRSVPWRARWWISAIRACSTTRGTCCAATACASSAGAFTAMTAASTGPRRCLPPAPGRRCTGARPYGRSAAGGGEGGDRGGGAGGADPRRARGRPPGGGPLSCSPPGKDVIAHGGDEARLGELPRSLDRRGAHPLALHGVRDELGGPAY